MDNLGTICMNQASFDRPFPMNFARISNIGRDGADGFKSRQNTMTTSPAPSLSAREVPYSDVSYGIPGRANADRGAMCPDPIAEGGDPIRWIACHHASRNVEARLRAERSLNEYDVMTLLSKTDEPLEHPGDIPSQRKLHEI